MNPHSSPFTFAGRLVILLAIVIAIGGTAAYFSWQLDSMDGSYPLITFAMPPFVLSVLFVALSIGIMRLLRIPFFNERKND